MPNRRTTLRAVLALVAATLAVAGLSGCRTDPTTAAYVGNQTIGVRQLNDAVAQRKAADPAVAKYADANSAAFTRQVLGLLVDQRVYAAASDRYGVQVSDDQVRSRINTLLASSDADQQYATAAAQGYGRADVFELVRQQLTRIAIARQASSTDPLSAAALRARYQRELSSLAQKPIGLITVADQPTADGILGQLTADPHSYPTLAAQHPGQNTLPALQALDTSQLPTQIASGIDSAAPNTGFTVPLQGVGVVVVFVGTTVVPTFDQERATLEQQAESELDKTGATLVDKVEKDLKITINPRYGVLQNGSIAPASGGVVHILGGSGTGNSAGPTAAAGG